MGDGKCPDIYECRMGRAAVSAAGFQRTVRENQRLRDALKNSREVLAAAAMDTKNRGTQRFILAAIDKADAVLGNRRSKNPSEGA